MTSLFHPDWDLGHPSFTPTVLLGRLPEPAHAEVMEALIRQGWDVRTLGIFATESKPNAESASLLSAARAVRPELTLISGTETDPWAQRTILEMRSDPDTSDLGLVVWSLVSVPDDMDVTPMSGADAWIYPSADSETATDVITRTARAALEGRLEWTHRDWTESDRRRSSLKSVQLRIEQGRNVNHTMMAAALFGVQSGIDTRVWDKPSPHFAGWRYGSDPRYHAGLLVHHERSHALDQDVSDQTFTMYSRSGRLLIAACHAAAEMAGGWPVLDLFTEE